MSLKDWFQGRRQKQEQITEEKTVDIQTLVERLDNRGKSSAGIPISEQTALESPTFHTAVKAIAQTIASLPIDIVRKTATGGREKVNDHDLYKLLAFRPNNYHTSYDYWLNVATNLAIHNVSYNGISRTLRGRIVNLDPYHPSTVRPELTEDYDMLYHVDMQGGKSEVLRSDRMHRIMMFSTNGVDPVSNITTLRDSIALEIAATRRAGAEFAKDGVPNVVIKHPSHFKDDEVFARFKKGWREMVNGSGTAILEDGMDIAKAQHSAVEMQSAELMKASRSILAGVLRISPHLVGDLSRATHSNIEMLSIEFIIYTLMPYFKAIEAAFCRDLLRPSEQGEVFLKFNLDALLRGDSKTRAETLKIWREMGALNVDEIRQIEDRQPLPDGLGEQYIRPLNYAVVGEDVEEEPEPVMDSDSEDDTE